MSYRRILVPIDGSDTSKKALAAAIGLARETGAQILLVHSVDDFAYVTGFEASVDVVGMARGAGEQVLQEARAMVEAAGLAVEASLIEWAGKRLGETISDEATRVAADLIVVGTHGRRGFSRALLGSGAEQIIRTAPVPVLVVRGSEKDS